MSNGTHLEYVASLVSDPDLKDAAKAAEETLRVKSRGTVHALGSGVAVNMVSSEELLQTWNIYSPFILAMSVPPCQYIP